ncbi:hypothetical protein [Buttiauxella agrestis]|uniref:hypothetical protein n=1 Tax=Buttiauxella agrestis TaxID=82977 RepID=UPI0039766FB8
MDWLTFISKLVENCAWPGLIAFIVFRYKSSLLTLVNSLSSLKVGDFVDASFSREAAKVATDSEAELPNTVATDEQKTLEDKLLELPPRLAILDSWKIVEEAINDIVASNKLGSNITTSSFLLKGPPNRKISYLRQENYLTPTQTELLDKLRKLRNEVVHGPYGLEPSQLDAVNYVKSALAFANMFKLEIDNGV